MRFIGNWGCVGVRGLSPHGLRRLPSPTHHPYLRACRDRRGVPPFFRDPKPTEVVDSWDGIKFGRGRAFGGQRVCVLDAGKSVQVFDLAGTLIIEHPWPKPDTTYVSNRRPPPPQHPTTGLSEMS